MNNKPKKKPPTIAELRARVARGELKAAMCVGNRVRSDTGEPVKPEPKRAPPKKKPTAKANQAKMPPEKPYCEKRWLAEAGCWLDKAERTLDLETRMEYLSRADLVLAYVELQQMEQARADIAAWSTSILDDES